MHVVDPPLRHPQDEESVTDADRWRAVDAASLHGKYCTRHTDTTAALLHLKAF